MGAPRFSVPPRTGGQAQKLAQQPPTPKQTQAAARSLAQQALALAPGRQAEAVLLKGQAHLGAEQRDERLQAGGGSHHHLWQHAQQAAVARRGVANLKLLPEVRLRGRGGERWGRVRRKAAGLHWQRCSC